MYTAKVKNKEFVNGQIVVTVEFSDGTTTVTETCKPQNKDGFTMWLRSRLETFNSAPELDAELALDATIDPTPVPVEEPVLTADELAEQQWFKDYAQWLRVKTTLVDTGVVPLNNPKVQALLSKVQTNLKAEYVDKL